MARNRFESPMTVGTEPIGQYPIDLSDDGQLGTRRQQRIIGGILVASLAVGLSSCSSETEPGPDPAPPPATAPGAVEAGPTGQVVEEDVDRPTAEDGVEAAPVVITEKPPHEYTLEKLDAMSFEQYEDTYIIDANIYDTPEKVANRAVENFGRYINLHIEERRTMTELGTDSEYRDFDFWAVPDWDDKDGVQSYFDTNYSDSDILDTMLLNGEDSLPDYSYFEAMHFQSLAYESQQISDTGQDVESYKFTFEVDPDLEMSVQEIGPTDSFSVTVPIHFEDNTENLPNAALYKVQRDVPAKYEGTQIWVFEFVPHPETGNWVINGGHLKEADDRSHNDVYIPDDWVKIP